MNRSHVKLGLILWLALPASALADSGFYIGGSVGGATLDANLGNIPGLPNDIDEDDTAFKGFVGYRLDLPSTFLGIEGGYVDLGKADFTVLDQSVSVDTSGVNLWGMAGLEAGPLEFFLKAGYIAWDKAPGLTHGGHTGHQGCRGFPFLGSQPPFPDLVDQFLDKCLGLFGLHPGRHAADAVKVPPEGFNLKPD